MIFSSNQHDSSSTAIECTGNKILRCKLYTQMITKKFATPYVLLYVLQRFILCYILFVSCYIVLYYVMSCLLLHSK